MSYEEVREHLCQLNPGWDYHAVDDLSWDQIDCALRRGKPDAGVEVGSIDEAIEVNKNWRHYAGI